MDSLPHHLASAYGVKVKKVSQLQKGNHGVHRVDLAGGGSWVVRLFPSDRPIADVKGDAAVLRFLEKSDFPAERSAGDVSVHEGQGVLVTEYIKGSKPKIDTATQSRLGDLLGRLHSMKGVPKPVRRPAGALHLYTVDHAVRSEIDTARAALEAGAFRGTDKAWERLRAALASADDFSSLPTALIHPDPASVNAILSGGQIRLIDWSGAGYGPRVLGLGLLLSAASSGKTFKREWVDAIMNAYSAHVSLQKKELQGLEAAIEHRLLVHEVYSWSVGRAMQRKPPSPRYWPRDNEGIAKMADYIRESWG
jgi:Ser/Thr protein kinase RdoA (MazF antagonist)